MYGLNFMDGQLRVELADGETILYKPQDTPMVNEDRFFVQMVASGDFSKLHSTYSDGIKTLEMTTRCLDVLNLPLGERIIYETIYGNIGITPRGTVFTGNLPGPGPEGCRPLCRPAAIKDFKLREGCLIQAKVDQGHRESRS